MWGAYPNSLVKEIAEGDLAEVPFTKAQIAAIYPLFPRFQESHDLVFIYSPGVPDSTSNAQVKILSLSDEL